MKTTTIFKREILTCLLLICISLANAQNGNNNPDLPPATQIPVVIETDDFDDDHTSKENVGVTDGLAEAIVNKTTKKVKVNFAHNISSAAVNIYKNNQLVSTSVHIANTDNSITTNLTEYGNGDYTLTLDVPESQETLWCEFKL